MSDKTPQACAARPAESTPATALRPSLAKRSLSKGLCGFKSAVFVKDRDPKRRYYLEAELAMFSSDIGIRRVSSCCTFSHFASRPILGDVFRWEDVSRSFHVPYCMSLSHNPLRGHSCLLAAADEVGVVAVFDPSAGSDGVDDFSPHVQANGNAIFDVKWALDDSFVASASADGTVCITNLAESRLEPTLLLKSKVTSHIKSVACHPQHINLLASGSRDGTLAVWDTRSRKAPMTGGLLPLLQHPSAPDCISPSRSLPTSKLAQASPQGARSLTGIDFLNGNSMITCSADGRVCLWDTRNFSSPFLMTDASNRKLRALTCVRVSPCRTRAAFLSASGSCFVQTLPYLDNEAFCTVIPLCPDPELDWSFKLDWSPCGRFLACGSKDSHIHIVDMALGIVVLKLQGHGSSVTDVAWFKNRTGLLSLGDEGQIRVWNPTMPKL
jgi:WD40 repeat protein